MTKHGKKKRGPTRDPQGRFLAGDADPPDPPDPGGLASTTPDLARPDRRDRKDHTDGRGSSGSPEQLSQVPPSDPNYGSARARGSDRVVPHYCSTSTTSQVRKHSHDGSHHHRSGRADELIHCKTEGSTLSERDLATPDHRDRKDHRDEEGSQCGSLERSSGCTPSDPTPGSARGSRRDHVSNTSWESLVPSRSQPSA